MKLTFFCVLTLLALSDTQWHFNLEEARQIAKKENRYILLNFSGSDWCGPCIRMRNEIFENEIFINMADTALVLVNADFPRLRKNKLSTGQQQINNQMAESYNPNGKFPFTVLLNAEGKMIKEWDGYPETKPDQFSSMVRLIIDEDRLHQ